MAKGWTRDQRMCDECTHEEYFRQFVTSAVLNTVRLAVGLERIMESTDPHLNDIPMGCWDRMEHSIGQEIIKVKREQGLGERRGYSNSDAVCTAKQAARMMQEHLRGVGKENPTLVDLLGVRTVRQGDTYRLKTALINGVETAAPAGALAYKYADPVSGARWVYGTEDAGRIAQEDPGLLEWVKERDEPVRVETVTTEQEG